MTLTGPRDPKDLSKRARAVLEWLGGPVDSSAAYPLEITCEGLQVWLGKTRTNLNVVRQLLECCFISSNSHAGDPCVRYAITEAGRRFLRGEPPYRDVKGEWHETLFSLLAKMNP